MALDPGGSGGSGGGLGGFFNGLIGPAPTISTRPVNPLTGTPVPSGNLNSGNPTSPVDRPAAPSSDISNGGGDVPVTRDIPTGRLINPRHHPLQEATFRLGRENSRRNPHRGTMVRVSEKVGSDKYRIPAGQNYKFRFLYNPETITVNSNVYTGVVAPEFRNPADQTQAKFVGQESMSFGLMLDRTQEVYEEGLNQTLGTLVDLDALYKVVNGSIGMNAGFLYLSEVEVHFGPSNALPVFRGYVTGINVTHTKFTPNMTPMRSIVEVNMARLSDSGAGANVQALFGDTGGATSLPAAAGGAQP